MNRIVTGVLAACAVLATGLGARAVDGAREAAREAFRRPAAIPFPEENPYTPQKAALGRRLFFDPILSNSGTMSCATCHDPALAWGDGRARAVGDAGSAMAWRSPTLLDIAELQPLGWDGKFRSLEAVTFAPITGRGNMNLPEAELLRRLGADPSYVSTFEEVFGAEGISRRTIERAIATFERTIVPALAPFDRWVAGEEGAIGPAARRGFALFTGKAACAECHAGPAFTDGSFHDIGTAGPDEPGRGRFFPGSVKLQHAFKTPTLREVTRRAPYMHDGSVPTLAAVIDLYDRGGVERPSRSPLIRPLGLSAQEKADLLAFLRTLSSEPEDTASLGGR